MASKHFRVRRVALAATLCGAACGALQAAEVVTVTARALPSIAGFGGVDAASLPLAVDAIGSEQIAERGARSLADLVRLDAAVSDAYNAEGYWSAVSVRGFTLDQRYNYRRDGLPISAETWIPLSNKERVEILQGTSGVQAGTSAPGGLVNYVVKRPTTDLREARVEWRERGSVLATADLSQRFGDDGRFGVRLNVGGERLRPEVRAADGSSRWFALAGDWRVVPGTQLEAEFEWSRHAQPSVPGFSVLGDAVPDAARIDPRININNQPWSLPVVFTAQTASLRWRQRLAADWQFTAHGAVQELRNDDRAAFPFGCTDAASGTYYMDRYCPDGSLDLYDYRSEGERRRVVALDLRFEGTLAAGGVEHRLSTGLMASGERDRLPRLAYNYAGPGDIAADTIVPPAPALTSEGTQRDERSVELYARDRVALGAAWTLWLGARVTRVTRDSVLTDGSQATHDARTFTTPWLALSHALDAHTTLYASWGQGVELQVVPNLPIYTNAGQPLPALRSRQAEVGVKQANQALTWSLVAFDISRPLPTDSCDSAVPPTCTRVLGAPERHRGVEAAAAWRTGALDLQGSVQALHARQAGERPPNVPALSARAQIGHRLPTRPGNMELYVAATYDGPRIVLPGEPITIAGATHYDLGARWQTQLAGVNWTARLGVDNATDKRAWRESPYQFAHAYLFPLAPRTWRASLAAAF